MLAAKVVEQNVLRLDAHDPAMTDGEKSQGTPASVRRVRLACGSYPQGTSSQAQDGLRPAFPAEEGVTSRCDRKNNGEDEGWQDNFLPSTCPKEPSMDTVT